jgi:N utilization substance protein B
MSLFFCGLRKKTKIFSCQGATIFYMCYYHIYKIGINKGVHIFMKRRTAREKALQALFQIDMSNTEPSIAIEHVLDEVPQDEYLTQLVTGVVEHKEEIDEIIKKYLEKWTLDRISTVDRNLLRVAVYELLFTKDEVPANVVLDEAIEIAKLYGDDQSSRFVNGILSKIKSEQL